MGRQGGQGALLSLLDEVPQTHTVEELHTHKKVFNDVIDVIVLFMIVMLVRVLIVMSVPLVLLTLTVASLSPAVCDVIVMSVLLVILTLTVPSEPSCL